MKKRFDEEQIIGFLREAKPGCRSRTCATGTVSAKLYQPGVWQYNDNNELLSWGTGPNAVTYQYDANGHTVKETRQGEITDYIYNAAERLSEVKQNAATLATYQYDPMGRRIRKEANGQITWFQYSEQGLIAEYGPTGTLKRTYGWQPQGLWGTDPVFLADVTGGGQATFWQLHHYHNDHLGTPQRLTDAEGSQTWAAISEAFGRTIPDPGNAVDNPLRFPGQYYDPETRMHQNYFREYNPNISRYVETDPIHLDGGINFYLYANGRPNHAIDPTGEAACCMDEGASDSDCCNKQDYGGALGLTVCCNGRKIACMRPDLDNFYKNSIVKACATLHEDEHVRHDEGDQCRPCGMYPVRPDKDWPHTECYAYALERRCLDKKKCNDAGSLNAKKVCRNEIAARIKQIDEKENGRCPKSS